MEVNILANVMPDAEPPALDPQLLKLKAIVKVFVIDSTEGVWLDCGAGDAQFVVRPGASEPTADDVSICVLNTYEEPQSRDFIDAARERRLRNQSADTNTLLDVGLGKGGDFNKCHGRRR